MRLAPRGAEVTRADDTRPSSVRPWTGEGREPVARASRKALSLKGQTRPPLCRRGSCSGPCPTPPAPVQLVSVDDTLHDPPLGLARYYLVASESGPEWRLGRQY